MPKKILPKNIETAQALCSKPFAGQFSHYYERWADPYQLGHRMLNADMFTEAVNQHLSGMRESVQLLEAADIGRILAGERVPDAHQLLALCFTFKIFGDQRDDFIEQAELRRRELAAAEEKKWQDAVLPLRRMNPGGDTELPSFGEMVEESFRAKQNGAAENINTLLWDRVFSAWGKDGDAMSPVQFSALVRQNSQGSGGRGTLSDTTIYDWRNIGYKPLAESVDVLCKAFGLAQEPAISSGRASEWMLWHVIDGGPFKNPYAASGAASGNAASEIRSAIEGARNSKNHGPLIRALANASGIPILRLQAIIGSRQLHPWFNGAHAENVSAAKHFLDMVHPPALQEDPPGAARQNEQMLELLTGRTFDLADLMKDAQKEGVENPGGKLFMALTGRRGLVKVENLVSEFVRRGHDVSQCKINAMRQSVHHRGGAISEPLAKAIMDIVQEKSPIPVDKKEYDDCIDILTNCPSPSKLLAKCVQGELAIGDMVYMYYKRKDLKWGAFQKIAGTSHLSDALLAKCSMHYNTAHKLAAWLGLEGEEWRRFTALATGHAASLNPGAILDQVRAGTISRVDGLRLIYDASGLPRPALGEACGIDVAYSVMQVSQGRIVAPADNIRKLAVICGLKGREDEFIHTFDARWVSRVSAAEARNNGSHRVSGQ